MIELRLFHKFFGIIIAYFGFFVFFSGTSGYYKNEITLFMQPEHYKLQYNTNNSIKFGLNYLTKYHKNADIWEILPPNAKRPYIVISYKDNKNAFQRKIDKPKIKLDPATGEKITARSTYGGNFFSSLHYNLWFVYVPNARNFIGYLSILMLFVLISGVIIRNKKLSFKFSQRYFWQDIHILASICGLIVFLSLCISGIYLNERFMLRDFYTQISLENKQTMQKNFESKVKAKREARKNRNSNFFNNIPTNKAVNFVPNAKQVENIIRLNQNNRIIKRIIIQKNNPNTAYIQLDFQPKQIFTKNGFMLEAEIYDIKSTKLIDSIGEIKLNTAQKISRFMRFFHRGELGNFAKFIFFIFGIVGLIMCVSALKSVEENSKSKVGKNLTVFFNKVVLLGLNLAFGIYLLSNQLIPNDINFRHNVEVNCFFGALIFSGIVAIIFHKKYSRTILSLLICIVFFVVGVNSIINGSYNNLIIMQISIFTLLYSFLFFYFARKFMKAKM